MAQTTVELRHLLRTNFKLFDFDYQFDDPVFKAQLEEHVIEHYYSYEIGFETPDMFKQRFKAKWKRMIGYYNELYNTTLLEYNPLITTSMSEALEQLGKSNTVQDSDSTTSNKGKGSADSQTTTESDSTTNEKASDYPQQDISGGDYLSGEKNTTNRAGGESNSLTATTSEDNGTASTKSTAKSENETAYQKTIEGISGTSYQELIRQQRSLIIRIPDMVIEELKGCFMMVF